MTCRALLLDLASDLLLSLALRLGTVYRRSWDVLLRTLPLGVVWRRSCSLELMAFLLTLSSGVLRRWLEGAVRPFGRRLGWRRCTASQLHPLFVGGAVQIAFDWLIDWLIDWARQTDGSIVYNAVFQPLQRSRTLCSNFDCSRNPCLFWGDSWGRKSQNSRPKAESGGGEPPPHRLRDLGEHCKLPQGCSRHSPDCKYILDLLRA